MSEQRGKDGYDDIPDFLEQTMSEEILENIAEMNVMLILNVYI